MHSHLNKFLVLVVGIIIGYFLASSAGIAVAPTHTSSSTIDHISVKSEPEIKEVTLKVVDRKVIEGSGDITVREGDVVSMTIVANEDEELHLHGYDKTVDLTKNEPSTLTFIANISGKFPFELEHSKTELGAVSVLPK